MNKCLNSSVEIKNELLKQIRSQRSYLKSQLEKKNDTCTKLTANNNNLIEEIKSLQAERRTLVE